MGSHLVTIASPPRPSPAEQIRLSPNLLRFCSCCNFVVFLNQVERLRDRHDMLGVLELRSGLRGLLSDADADAWLFRGCGLSTGQLGPGGVRVLPPLPDTVPADAFLLRCGIVPRGQVYT